MEEIPALIQELDEDSGNAEKLSAVTEKLQETIDRLDEDAHKYLIYIGDDKLSEDTKKASGYLTDGFLYVNGKALEPLLAYYSGESTDIPAYSDFVNEVKTDCATAEELIK